MRIVLVDPVQARFESLLREHSGGGHDWLIAAGWPAADVVDAMPEADVFVGSDMTDDMAAAGRRLRLVQVTGAGFERIPITSLPPAAAVANTFNHGRSIAEHVLMSMLALSRDLLRVDWQLRAGVWESVVVDPSAPLASTLEGRRLGLVGLGHIAQETARLATALGMRAAAVRRNPGAPLPDDLSMEWVGGLDDLPRLLEGADCVVVTVPLSDETAGLLGAAELARMKASAFLVNVSRGPVVDEAALYRSLAEGQIAGAALDVWWSYPKDGAPTRGSELPFHELANVVMTPHASANTVQTFEGRAHDIASNIRRLAAGQPLRNVVRAPLPG